VAAGGAAAGFVQTGNLKGAVLGGLEAGVDFGIGQSLPFSGADANPAGNIAAHAISGGVLSVLRGGKFGHGFVAAGLQAAIDPQLPSNGVVGGIAASIVGGSISQLTGGKFANGAISGAFQFSFNEMLHMNDPDRQPQPFRPEGDVAWNKIMYEIRDLWDHIAPPLMMETGPAAAVFEAEEVNIAGKAFFENATLHERGLSQESSATVLID
jgi:hypothetical protein